MLRPLALPLAATLLLAPRLGAQSTRVPGRYDNQWRPEVGYSAALSPRLEASASAQLQFAQRSGGLIQARVGGGLQLAATRWLSLAAAYQHYRGHSLDGDRVTEHRPTAAAILRTALPRGLGLQDRSLFELRDRGGERSYRIRNRLTLERRSRLAGRDLRLYLSEEPYYDSRYAAWVRNQATLGGATAVSRHLSAELYVMRQDDGRSRPGDLVVVGTVLRVR